MELRQEGANTLGVLHHLYSVEYNRRLPVEVENRRKTPIKSGLSRAKIILAFAPPRPLCAGINCCQRINATLARRGHWPCRTYTTTRTVRIRGIAAIARRGRCSVNARRH